LSKWRRHEREVDETLANASRRLGFTVHKSFLRGYGRSRDHGIEYQAEWRADGKTYRLSNLHLGQNEILIFEELSTVFDASAVVNRLRLLTAHGEGQGEVTAPLM
jgi:hypothetical protein